MLTMRSGIAPGRTRTPSSTTSSSCSPGCTSKAGCKALNIPAHYLENNRDSCLGCGRCNYGCRYNRKTSMLVTYIPWAEACGVEVLDQCMNAAVLAKGNAATGVKVTRLGKETTVEAERVVVCAGEIGSSEVLLKSGIALGGRVGQGLHALGGVFVMAETDEIQDGFDGIGLTCVAHASVFPTNIWANCQATVMAMAHYASGFVEH